MLIFLSSAKATKYGLTAGFEMVQSTHLSTPISTTGNLIHLNVFFSTKSDTPFSYYSIDCAQSQ